MTPVSRFNRNLDALVAVGLHSIAVVNVVEVLFDGAYCEFELFGNFRIRHPLQ